MRRAAMLQCFSVEAAAGRAAAAADDLPKWSAVLREQTTGLGLQLEDRVRCVKDRGS